MKILHCIPSLVGGGAERQLSILVPAQVAMGSSVHVASLEGGGAGKEMERAGATYHKIPAAGNHDPRILLELWRLLRSEKPDVAHTWLPQMDIAAGITALASRTPWVLAERSNVAAYTRRAKDRLVRRMLGRWADAVAANSVGGQDLWSGVLHRGSRAHVVRNALALSEIDAAVPISREALEIGPGEKIVLFAGRLAPEKGIDELLTVAEILSKVRPGAILVICGDGPLRDQVTAYIRRTASSHRVKLLGYRNDIWSIMKTSNVMISTSHFEGHPNAILEAMACKCPLVVSNISAHREFLDEGTAAVMPLEAEALAEAVARVIDGSPEVDRKREAARRHAETLDARNAAASYDAIYREAIAHRHSRHDEATRPESRI